VATPVAVFQLHCAGQLASAAAETLYTCYVKLFANLSAVHGGYKQ